MTVPPAAGRGSSIHRPGVTLLQLRYFVEVAEKQSMTGAARAMMVAQSAVSTAIGQLERALGADLFIRRRPRGVVLTPTGAEFLRDASNLLSLLDEIVDSAQSHGAQVRGSISIVCFTTLAPFVLPGVLADLADDHPDLEVTVAETNATQTLEALHNGSAELAITYDFGFSADIDCETVAEAPPYVLLPEGHSLARLRKIDLGQLADEPMVMLDLPQSTEYFLQLLRDAGVRAHVRYRSASYEAVRTLVARGHGFSILNQRPRYNTTYDGARVAQVPITGSAQPPLRVVIARLASTRQTMRAQAIAVEVRRHFQLPSSFAPPNKQSASPPRSSKI